MAHSNYRVLTNADLSGNEIYNVSGIVNNEEDSKALSIETKGDTTLKVAKLTGIVDGETFLKTNTSNVTVTDTAIETITTSKTTTVETASTATKTTEKIDVEGISINTPSQKVTATGSAKTVSPSIVAITEEVENEVDSKGSYSKIELSKTGATATITAKKYTVDADVEGGSITQTAPTSIYKADKDNKVFLTTSSVEIRSSDAEILKLTKAVGSTPSSTDLTSNNLKLHVGTVEVDKNTSITTASKGTVTVKSNSTGKSDNENDTTLTLSNTTASLTAPIVSITSNSDAETSDTNRKIVATAGNTSATIKTTDINLTSAGTTTLSSTGNTTIETTGNTTELKLSTKNLVETANKIKLHSGDIVLQPSEADSTKQISLKDNTVVMKADSASITATGNNTDTVTIAGTELAVDSNSSTFKNNATFNKNVVVTGDLTTHNMTGDAATLGSLDVTATTTVTGKLVVNNDLILDDVTGKEAELTGKLTVTQTTGVTNTATIGTLKVTGELTANNGLESSGKVTIENKSNEDSSLTVSNTATTGTLIVDGAKTLEANGGLVSTGKVSVNGKDANDVSVTVNKTASTGTLTVDSAKTLEANGGLVSAGKVDIQNAGSNSGTSLTVSKTATTGVLDVTGTLTASGGLTSAGAVKIEKDDSVENALIVNTSATTDTLSVTGGLTANSGMTSNGKVTVSGTTDITTLTGDGKLTIPENYSLEAKNGGTTGSVEVSKVTINTIDGLGSLTIPNGKTLKADTATGSTAKVTGDFTPTNISVNTVKGLGSIEVASGKTLKIDPVSDNEAKVEGSFTPTNISIGTVEGNGSISISSGKTLTVKNNGTVNGSMIVGKSDSTATNMSINGTLTVGASGGTTTSLTSKVPVVAESTLSVTGKATFKETVEVAVGKDFVLNGVTIKWDSTLGALTFSRG